MNAATAVDDRWNPFSWRAADLAALGTSPEDEARRAQLTTEMLIAEADEAARGAAHLTIVHGDPVTVAESEHLDSLYAMIDRLTVKVESRRRRAQADHIIIAVGGDGADECLHELEAIAAAMNPGHWRITRSACPDLTGLVQ